MGIGKRNKKVNQAAIRTAKAIGPIDYGDDNSCEPLDVLKHFGSDELCIPSEDAYAVRVEGRCCVRFLSFVLPGSCSIRPVQG